MRDELGAPKIVERRTFQAELDALRVREKSHTREGDAIAATRRRLPMVEVDGGVPLIGERGAVTLLDAFEGRQMVIAYCFIWHAGNPAPETSRAGWAGAFSGRPRCHREATARGRRRIQPHARRQRYGRDSVHKTDAQLAAICGTDAHVLVRSAGVQPPGHRRQPTAHCRARDIHPVAREGAQEIGRILVSPRAVLAAGKNISEKETNSPMRNTLIHLALFAGALVPAAVAQTAKSQTPKYPPIDEYLMPQLAEIALAKSAAPANISDRATIKVLTTSGFTVVHQGDNGFVCMVMRGFSAPTYTPAQFRDLVYDSSVRAPICFDPKAAKEVMPYYELRTKLAMQRKGPDEIAEGVQAAYARGGLPKRDGVSFAYMWSADQNLASGIGHWHPHVMVFAPYYDNSMVGGNTFGAPLPQLSDDAGTPFAVVVIPVDHNLFVKADAK